MQAQEHAKIDRITNQAFKFIFAAWEEGEARKSYLFA